MSVLIKGMDMPKEGGVIVIYKEGNNFYTAKAGEGEKYPLVEVPPHGDLINKEALYNKTAEWEAQALAQFDKLNRIPFNEMEKEEYIAWRVWSALYQERSAFKFDVFDAPVVIEAEGEEADEVCV